jgi:uncharacterized low-complexity protein
MSKKIMTAAIAATLLGLATIAVTSGPAQAEKRTFTVAAVEMKGGVTVDKAAVPDRCAAGRCRLCSEQARSDRPLGSVGLHVDAEPDYRQPGR